jgi:hypothetical protein
MLEEEDAAREMKEQLEMEAGGATVRYTKPGKTLVRETFGPGSYTGEKFDLDLHCQACGLRLI